MGGELAGVIKQWNDHKGFGFIRAERGADVFFHITVLYGDRRPAIGDKIFYLEAKDEHGRPVAKHVRHAELKVDSPAIRIKPEPPKPVRPSPEPSKKNKRRPLHYLKIIFFMVLLVLPVTGLAQLWVNYQFPWMAYLYMAASLIAFYLYWTDKQKAGTDARRVPEATLHFFELLGGWAGALIAQQLFRHKTRKISFQLIFWLIVVVHQALWFDLLFWSEGFRFAAIKAG